MSQIGVTAGMMEVTGMSGAKSALGGFAGALAATVILACITLGVYIQAQKSDDKNKNSNIVTGTLAASVGVGSLTLLACFATLGKMNAKQKQQQMQQRVRSSMGRQMGQFR